MQRTIVRASQSAFRSANIGRKGAFGGSLHLTPLPSAGPSRLFSSTPISLKKAKLAPAKPSKGKVRAEDDPSETDVDTEGVLTKTREKMEKAVSWAKGLVYDGVERGRGKVSPGQFTAGGN
jgi:ribosome recycling factor